MNQQEFEKSLKKLVRQPLTFAKFEDVKPVAELLLYSEYLPTTMNNLSRMEKRRLLFLVEKFRRYSCSTVSRRQQLKSFADRLSTDQLHHTSQTSQLVDPLAKKLGLNEDLNHLKPQLLSMQTRHYTYPH
jgi:hypothetical protein